MTLALVIVVLLGLDYIFISIPALCVFLVFEFYKMRTFEESIDSEFFATITHELRTPLNGINGGVELLKDSELSSEQKKLVSTIETSSKIILEIVNDLLEFEKIKSGKVDIVLKPENLERIINQSFQANRVLAGNKFIGFELKTSGTDFVGLVDGTRLRQILNNLISNAIKFTNDGAVTIDSQYEESSSSLIIRVSDSGIGIGQDQLKSIFTSFTQAKSDTTSKYGGTGLGLSITKKITNLMGGKISVESEVGVGTTFTVEIPVEKSDQSVEQPRVSNVVELKELMNQNKIKVLVADDNQINRTVMEKYLAKLSIKADFAIDGEEALEACQFKDYDLAFLDFNMPKMSGLEVAKRLKKDKPHIYLIACSASLTEENASEYLQLGFDHTLPKPINMGHLEEIIFDYFQHKDIA